MEALFRTILPVTLLGRRGIDDPVARRARFLECLNKLCADLIGDALDISLLRCAAGILQGPGPPHPHRPVVRLPFSEGKPTNLLSELGVFYVNEEYSTLPDDKFVGPGCFVDLDHELFGGDLRLYHKHYAIVNGSDKSKVIWHSWTGVSVPLFDNFVTSLEFEANYDSQLALREKDLDTTVHSKLGYEW